MRPATVKLAQILILPPASEESKMNALEKISRIEEKVHRGEDFADLAEKYSEGPSAKYGGNLGFIKLGDLNNPEFEKAASKLEPGETSQPVLTDFGYHLIKLEEIDGEDRHIRHILVKVEAPVTLNEVGIGREILLEALLEAHKIRPERYTILAEGLSKQAAVNAIEMTGID